MNCALFALLCLRLAEPDAACLRGVQAQIEQWIEFSTHDIDAPLQSWVMPIRGRLPYDKKVPLHNNRRRLPAQWATVAAILKDLTCAARARRSQSCHVVPCPCFAH